MRCVVGLLAFSRPGSIPLPPLPVTVDSHLHLWPTTSPLVPPPPSPHSPCDAADAVIASSTDFSIVTQPIQLGHDHSYLADEIAPHKTLYGVALFDPTQPEGYEIDAYNALQPSKFIGMRFDPSLHPPPLPGTPAVPFKTLHIPTLRAFKHLGERHDGPNPTNAPNGVASFLFTNSLTPNYDALLELISASPTTPVVLDHFAFSKFTREGDVSFQLMLDLLKDAPSVNVRVSAGFRMFVEHPDPAIGLQVRRAKRGGLERTRCQVPPSLFSLCETPLPHFNT